MRAAHYWYSMPQSAAGVNSTLPFSRSLDVLTDFKTDNFRNLFRNSVWFACATNPAGLPHHRGRRLRESCAIHRQHSGLLQLSLLFSWERKL